MIRRLAKTTKRQGLRLTRLGYRTPISLKYRFSKLEEDKINDENLENQKTEEEIIIDEKGANPPQKIEVEEKKSGKWFKLIGIASAAVLVGVAVGQSITKKEDWAEVVPQKDIETQAETVAEAPVLQVEPKSSKEEVTQIHQKEQVKTTQESKLVQAEKEGENSKQNTPEKPEDGPTQEKTQAKATPPVEAQGALFQELFLNETEQFEIKPLEKGKETKLDDLEDDNIIFLVPPKEDENFLKQLKTQLAGVVQLYDNSRNNSASRQHTHHGEHGSEHHALRVRFINIRSKQDLAAIGKNLEVDLRIKNNIPLFVIKNKHLSKASVITLKDLYNDPDKLFLQFKPINVLHNHNTNRFSGYLKELEPAHLLIFQYHDPKEAGYKSTLSKFYKSFTSGWFGDRKHSELFFMKDKSFFEEHVKDLQSGDYLLLKKVDKNESTHEIDGNFFQILRWAPDDSTRVTEDEVIESLGQLYYQNNTFVHRDLPISNEHFSVDVRVDMNRIQSSQMRAVKGILADVKIRVDSDPELKDKVKFYLVPKCFSYSEGNFITFKVRSNYYAHLDHEYFHENTSLKRAQELEKEHPDLLQHRSYEHSLPPSMQIDVEPLFQFVKLAVEGKLPDSYKSQTPRKYTRKSRKVVGKNFKENIVETPLNQILMIYSKHCASCKRFTPVYEKLAAKNIEEAGIYLGQPAMFNRMDGDRNMVEGCKNFFNTPVFAVYRNKLKDRPFIYKGTMMTEKIMRDFFSVTLGFRVMSDNLVNPLMNRIAGFESLDKIQI